MIPNQVTLLQLWRKQVCSCGRINLSWQGDNDRQCSNWTRVFSWFNILRDCLMFWKVCIWRVSRELEGPRKNEPNGSVIATSLTVYRWRRMYCGIYIHCCAETLKWMSTAIAMQ
jgi:hypothetical protein